MRKFRSSRSDDDLTQYRNARKEFKNATSEKRKAYNSNKLDKLMSSINDAKSWVKLKALTNKSKSKLSNNISKTEWLIHFENLFANPDNNEAYEDIEIDEPDNEIEELIFNSEITDDEIVFAVKSLIAGIIPEMFISILEVVPPVLNELLNRLFSHGKFP